MIVECDIYVAMIRNTKVLCFYFQKMARTRGGLIGNRGRGRGRGRDRGRGRGVQPERVRLVELANIVSRSRPL